MTRNISKRWVARLRHAFVCGAIVITAVLAGSGCKRHEETPAPALSVQVGEPAPDFIFLDLGTSETASLASLKGKVVIADFWATWCVPCQAAMAEMQTYRDRHPKWVDSVELLAVSIDTTGEAAKEHVTKKGWNKTRNVWLNPEGGKNAAMLAYAGNGIPAQYVIGPDGVVAESGHFTESELTAIVARIQKSVNKP